MGSSTGPVKPTAGQSPSWARAHCSFLPINSQRSSG
jgi:hypothetical protein